MGSWYLEGYIDDRRETWRTNVDTFPFVIGRKEGVSLRLASPEVSARHAELFLRSGNMWLRDLGSKNGSFINDGRLQGEQALKSGDVVRFANWELRLVGTNERPTGAVTQTVAMPTAALPRNFLARLTAIREILDQRRLVAYYQPIVRLEDGGIVAYEALGRGLDAEDQMVFPGELFELVSALDREAELSEVFREKAVAEVGPLCLASPPDLFVNTHPAELRDGVEPLLASLARVLATDLPCQLVLEIHEAAVASPELLQRLAQGLVELGVDLAFDDFGTGQARLLELVDVSPRYLKFDRVWISGVHVAPPARRAMLERMVHMVHELGVRTLAEGVELAEEAAACRDMGFELAQGYHFGRPAPAR